MQKAPPGNGTLKLSGNIISLAANKPVSYANCQKTKMCRSSFFCCFISATTPTTINSTIFIKYPDTQDKPLSTDPAPLQSSTATKSSPSPRPARTLLNWNDIAHPSTSWKCATTPSIINLARSLDRFECSSIGAESGFATEVPSGVSFANSQRHAQVPGAKVWRWRCTANGASSTRWYNKCSNSGECCSYQWPEHVISWGGSKMSPTTTYFRGESFPSFIKPASSDCCATFFRLPFTCSCFSGTCLRIVRTSERRSEKIKKLKFLIWREESKSWLGMSGMRLSRAFDYLWIFSTDADRWIACLKRS